MFKCVVVAVVVVADCRGKGRCLNINFPLIRLLIMRKNFIYRLQFSSHFHRTQNYFIAIFFPLFIFHSFFAFLCSRISMLHGYKQHIKIYTKKVSEWGKFSTQIHTQHNYTGNIFCVYFLAVVHNEYISLSNPPKYIEKVNFFLSKQHRTMN
jgi:hypothetical protein